MWPTQARRPGTGAPTLVQRRLARALLPAAALGLLVVMASDMAGAASTDLRLNEIWPNAVIGPQSNLVQSRVELFNTGPGPELVGGFTLTNAAGTSLVTLPAWTVPAQGFLTVIFGSGSDDADFSDGAATYFTQGDSLVIFDAGADECALYTGSAVPANIADYVAWSAIGPYGGGASALSAVNAGIWTAGDFVSLAAFGQLSSLGLCPDGFDHDVASDWREFGWGDYYVSGGRTTVQNAVQVAPASGALLESASPELRWASVAAADSFRLQVDADSTFASPDVSLNTASTQYTVTAGLPDGLYFWRVQVYSGGALVPEHAVWSFAKLWAYVPKSGEAGKAPLTVVPNLTPLIQHKDTKLLCIYNPRAGTRPGCTEGAGAQGPWNDAHPTTVQHVPGCQHCNMYCTRAVITMVNNRYGGTLSQDRVALQLFPGAEPGLGHNQGTSLAVRFPVYAWALGLNQNQITRVAGSKPSFATVKTELDAGRPIYIDGQNHATLLYGYFELNLPPFGTIRLVFIANPWPGTQGAFTYAAWQPDGAGWGNAGYFLLPARGIAARAQEPEVAGDFDTDGVRDWDELTRFCSSPSDPDTDEDGISDGLEIRSYTFHSLDHPGHNTNAIGFSDVDSDLLRTECDCDSDNDNDYDAAEDINVDGRNPQVGETDVYRATSRQLAINVAVTACGNDGQPHPAGGTLRANWNYNVDVQPATEPCQPPRKDAPLAPVGAISTDASGNISNEQFACYAPGTYRMVIDAIPNLAYDPGCDPVICFRIERPVPVTVAGLSATASDGRVRLTWSLASAAQTAVTGILVQRAESANGPWLARTADPLVPAAQMEFVDSAVESGRAYWYQLVLQLHEGDPVALEPLKVTGSGAQYRTALEEPVDGTNSVQVRYSLARGATHVRLEVFDARGRHVQTLAEGPQAAGEFVLEWDRRDTAGASVSRGLYLIRLAAGEQLLTRKVILLH
jgi:hypothetical protein